MFKISLVEKEKKIVRSSSEIILLNRNITKRTIFRKDEEDVFPANLVMRRLFKQKQMKTTTTKVHSICFSIKKVSRERTRQIRS